MYVDYKYYYDSYGGRMPEEQFTFAERKAEAYIRYLTFVNGDIFAVSNDAIKDALCAAADVYYADASVREKQSAEGKEGTVKSESNDGYSVSYVTEQTDGQTAEDLVKRKAYDAVYPYLLASGWLYRGMRCRHDYQCRHHNL